MPTTSLSAAGFSKMLEGFGGESMDENGMEFNMMPQDEVEQDFDNEKASVKAGVKVKEKKANKKLKYLDSFAINLTKLAKEGSLDAVVGRTKELERLIQILNRRSKNNPALIGEPG